MEDTVARVLAVHAPPSGCITVALSGGVDSIVLLDCIRRVAPRLGLRVRALHVNHGLSPNAEAWQRFCAAHCKRRRIEFQTVRVAIGGAGRNVEAEARAARYRALCEHGSEVIALAHNRDDQAETVLLQLARGAGVRGLAAMPLARGAAGRQHGNAEPLFVRPLLEVARARILAHASRRRLRWVEDESNREERYARNFMRRRVLPLLETRFPGSKHAMARAAVHLQDAAWLLDQLAAEDCQDICQHGRMRLAALVALGPVRGANALRGFLRERGELALSTARMAEAWRQLTSAASDASPELPLGRGQLRRFRGWIEWQAERAAPAPPEVAWAGERCLDLGPAGRLTARRSRGRGVSAAQLARAPVVVRGRRGGERIRLQSNRPTRTLKNLLQEAGVPPWQRAALPLLFCGQQLVWAPGVGVAAPFQAKPGEPAWQFRWQVPGATPAHR